MRFERLYRMSIYVMLFLATLALNVDMARDNPIAPLYPIAVALAAAFALVTVDIEPPGWVMPWYLNGPLAVGAAGLSILEVYCNSALLVLAIGHFLVYLQIIMILGPKTDREDWFFFLLALTEVIVGAFQPGDWAGPTILVWSVAAMWCMGLFHLRREAARENWRRTGDEGPYPKLVDVPFIVSTVKMALLTLVLGGVIFLVMPRWNMDSSQRFQSPGFTQHLTGFSDQVRLGQLGTILESDAVVLTVQMLDETDRIVEPPSEALWRGISLQTYEDGGWKRRSPWALDLSNPSIDRPPLPTRYTKQVIKIEQNDTDVLFGLRPVLWADGADLALDQRDGSLYRLDLRPDVSFVRPFNHHPGAYTYTVYSSLDANHPQPFETTVRHRPDDPESELLEVPTGMRPRLEKLVESVLANVPPDTTERARALEAYLRDGNFRYTLEMNVVDPTIDPVEDFLFNRKEGHCEYFASALTLLLRTANIPARLVNGFKGGDWNSLAQITYVRQMHAHSWVEAWAGESGRGERIWLTLDPTPARERDAQLAKIGGFSSKMHFATDYFRYLWVFYVVGYDRDRQHKLIYEPARKLLDEAKRGFAVMWEFTVKCWRWFSSLTGSGQYAGMLGVLLMLLVLAFFIGTATAVIWVIRRHWSRRHNTGLEVDDRASAVLIYRRLVAILDVLGLKRSAPETPREFSRRAAQALACRGIDQAEFPPRVAEAFYQVRFGEQPLGPELLRELEEGLDSLEAALASPAPS